MIFIFFQFYVLIIFVVFTIVACVFTFHFSIYFLFFDTSSTWNKGSLCVISACLLEPEFGTSICRTWRFMRLLRWGIFFFMFSPCQHLIESESLSNVWSWIMHIYKELRTSKVLMNSADAAHGDFFSELNTEIYLERRS